MQRAAWLVLVSLTSCAPAAVPPAPPQVVVVTPVRLPPASSSAPASASSAPPPAPVASASAAAAPEEPPPPPVHPPSTKGMVLLPGGSYIPARSRTSVTLAPFWLDVTEVTVGAYAACVAAGKCTEDGLACDSKEKPAFFTYRRPGKENHPITCVDMAQAKAYCAFVGKRLPRDIEFEWAARGATRGSTYPWGETEPNKQLCWHRFVYGTGQGKGTCQVHSFPKGDSPQGIADLAGNVDEWATPSPPQTQQNFGGDWAEADPGLVAAGIGRGTRPDLHMIGVGFRCAGDGP